MFISFCFSYWTLWPSYLAGWLHCKQNIPFIHLFILLREFLFVFMHHLISQLYSSLCQISLRWYCQELTHRSLLPPTIFLKYDEHIMRDIYLSDHAYIHMLDHPSYDRVRIDDSTVCIINLLVFFSIHEKTILVFWYDFLVYSVHIDDMRHSNRSRLVFTHHDVWWKANKVTIIFDEYRQYVIRDIWYD